MTLTNIGPAPCTLYDLPGIQLVGANGRPQPTQRQGYPGGPPPLIVLKPDQHAMVILTWNISSPPNVMCYQPAGINVYPKNDQDVIKAGWKWESYCGPVKVTTYRHSY